MRNYQRHGKAAGLVVMLTFALGLTGAAWADQPESFADALALAAKQDRVLVVDFFTDW